MKVNANFVHFTTYIFLAKFQYESRYDGILFNANTVEKVLLFA